MSTDLRVVVVTYSPGATLGTFLASLAGATTASYEVVLADNGSTDGSVEAAVTDGVRLLRTGGNVGYGRAANLGAADADTGWLLVANPDVVLHPGALDELMKAHARWPQAGAFGPLIRTPQGGLYPSARNLPSLGRGIGHALLGWWWPSNPWTKAYRNEQGDPVEGEVGWLSGSCLLLRTSAFDAVGGFDPTYFMYFEDLDLCARLTRSGTACVYVPTAVVEHSGGHATQRDPAVARAMLRAHHASAYQYLSRQYPRPVQAPLRWVLRAGLFARYLVGIATPKVGDGAQPTRSAS
jgi:N-acetylglucosaminyl-diphospho-decaprenol L-rhamnosyltransferase